MSKAVAALRAGEWWEHKLAPMFGTAYATAYLGGTPLVEAWPALVLALAAIAPGAAYVSLVNDLTDLDDDRAAGKANRLEGWRPGLALSAIGACAATGLAIALLAWRDDAAVAGLYAAAWLAFTLYSVPPVRLKARGFAGVLADAAGAHLFPHVLVALLVFRSTGEPASISWLALVAIWSLTLGLRGALLHQRGDIAADRRAGVHAYGATHPHRARWLGAFVAFPLELGALAAMLVATANPLAVALLALYALLEWLRVKCLGIGFAVVTPAPAARVAMQSYYVVLFPLAFLLAATVRHSADAALIVAHLVLFRREPIAIARELTWIGARALSAGR
jgi:4-hydroxybenzoate polyprenyltransferase